MTPGMGGAADKLNRLAWSSAKTVELFIRRSGYFCPGETRVMGRLAAEASGEPILDIGVGGGRTTPFLRQITSEYVGIDYLDELVAAARKRSPEARFEQVDARDLSRFTPGEFGAAVFSLNGIDGMSHRDRAVTFSEIHRILRPGGWFAYSTHNLAYTLASRWRPDPRRSLRHPLQAISFAHGALLRCWHRRRLRALMDSGDGWAAIVTRAYGHPVIWHHVSCEAALRELRSAHFDADIEVYRSDGRDALEGLREPGPSLPSLAHPDSPDLHVLARRP
jgi:SAM-dependent methyltransferase